MYQIQYLYSYCIVTIIVVALVFEIDLYYITFSTNYITISISICNTLTNSNTINSISNTLSIKLIVFLIQ